MIGRIRTAHANDCVSYVVRISRQSQTLATHV